MIVTGTYILADIDALLDTRIATIALYDPKVAIDVIGDQRYLKRLHDDFTDTIKDPDWDQESYELSYQQRNKVTLSYAKPTAMLVGLRKLFIELFSELSNNPEHTKYVLTVNLYPYDLTKEEKENIIICIGEWLPDFVELKYVSHSLEQLTPGFIKPIYTHWVTYSFNEWTTIHFGKELTQEQLLAMQNPHLKIMVPMMLKSKAEVKNYEAYLNQTKDKNDLIKNPFMVAMVTMSDTFELIFHPSETFCSIIR
jgi:hypothetical protein